MKKLLAGAAVIAVLAGLMTYATASEGAQDHGKASIPCGDDGTIEWSPTVLWPPNHKLRDIKVTYTDEDPPGQVSLALTATPHDEVIGEGTDAAEMTGSGSTPFPSDSLGGANTDDDGDVEVTAQARGERSGRGDGRVYEWEYDADSNIAQDGCESDPDEPGDGILVFVPHDCRDGGCGQHL